MKLLSTQRGIQELMGVLNFYRKFILQMAKKVVTLTEMLKKGACVRWTAVAEQGVRECIVALKQELILAYPDFTKTFSVTMEASSFTVGAVLSQEWPDGSKPVVYKED